MMTITNKTQRPVSVPLPRGKTLHLGPGKNGHISSKDVEYPQLKKMIDAGEIEVLGEGQEAVDGASGGKQRRGSMHGFGAGGGGRRSGDR